MILVPKRRSKVQSLFQFVHALMSNRFTVLLVPQGGVDIGWDELEKE
jgi:hypothetical protein